MSRMLLAFVTLAGMAQVSTGPAPLAGTPMPDPQAGRMGQARVTVINKDPKTEAIPVALVNAVEPLRVTLAAAPAVSVTGTVTALTQSAVQRWEYRVVNLTPAADIANALNGPGQDGWEVSGAVIARADGGASVILKRPR
jgi:hypothetical protein